MRLDLLVWNGQTQDDLEETLQIVSGFTRNRCNSLIQEYVVGASQPLPKRLWVQITEGGREFCVRTDEFNNPLKHLSKTELRKALQNVKKFKAAFFNVYDEEMLDSIIASERPRDLVFLYWRKD